MVVKVKLCSSEWPPSASINPHIPGSIIPVAPGRMRNLLYPRQKAAYVTEAQLREWKSQNIVIERDFDFGMRKLESEPTEPLKVKVELLTVRSFPDLATALYHAERHLARKNDRDSINQSATVTRFLSKPNTTATA